MKNVFSKKKIIMLSAILFVVIALIIAFFVINFSANKDKIEFPNELNSEVSGMLNDSEERIVNNFVEDMIDSYNSGDESNNYYEYLVYDSHKHEFDKMLENYSYKAKSTDEIRLTVRLRMVLITAIKIEQAATTGTIEGASATPDQIKIYIKDNINTLLNDLYY